MFSLRILAGLISFFNSVSGNIINISPKNKKGAGFCQLPCPSQKALQPFVFSQGMVKNCFKRVPFTLFLLFWRLESPRLRLFGLVISWLQRGVPFFLKKKQIVFFFFSVGVWFIKSTILSLRAQRGNLTFFWFHVSCVGIWFIKPTVFFGISIKKL